MEICSTKVPGPAPRRDFRQLTQAPIIAMEDPLASREAWDDWNWGHTWDVRRSGHTTLCLSVYMYAYIYISYYIHITNYLRYCWGILDQSLCNMLQYVGKRWRFKDFWGSTAAKAWRCSAMFWQMGPGQPRATSWPWNSTGSVGMPMSFSPPMSGNGLYQLSMVMTGGWFWLLLYPHYINPIKSH